jgi:hypothetical protein
MFPVYVLVSFNVVETVVLPAYEICNIPGNRFGVT